MGMAYNYNRTFMKGFIMGRNCMINSEKDVRSYDMEEIKKIGQRIAFYRKQRKMTQKVLAEKANISKSYLSKIESTGTDVTFSLLLLYQLAQALGLEPCQLLMPVNEEYLLGHQRKNLK